MTTVQTFQGHHWLVKRACTPPQQSAVSTFLGYNQPCSSWDKSRLKSFSLQFWQRVVEFIQFVWLTSHLVVYSSNHPVFVHRWKETFCCITEFDQRLKLVSCEIHSSLLKKGLFAKRCCISSQDHKKHC